MIINKGRWHDGGKGMVFIRIRAPRSPISNSPSLLSLPLNA